LLGIVKYNLAPIALGIASDCLDQDFLWYCDEAVSIAEVIIKNLAE
jgi:hypothetical protein